MYVIILLSLISFDFCTETTSSGRSLKQFYQKRNQMLLQNLANQEWLSHCLWHSFNMGPCYIPVGYLKFNFLVFLGRKPKSTCAKLCSRKFRKYPYSKSNTTRTTTTSTASTTIATSTTIAPPKMTDGIDFLRYHPLDTINLYLTSLPWKYPNIASVRTIGKSFEGRDLNLVRVTTGDVGAKAAIFIVGGMQANKWSSSAVVLYAIQQLIENPVNNYLLGKADWFLVPVANPDGYEYSYRKNQSWTKTRSLRPRESKCAGVDLNKNFDYNCHSKELFNNSCNDFYAGIEAFSENESNAIQNFILTYKYNIQLFINIDGYGQSIEFPIENTDRFNRDSSDLKFLADQVTYAMRKYGGRQYNVKSLNAPCGSEQWVRRIGMKYSYKFKLPMLASSKWKPGVINLELLPLVQEMFVALRELQRTAVAIYGVTYDLIADD